MNTYRVTFHALCSIIVEAENEEHATNLATAADQNELSMDIVDTNVDELI
jgi:hypothetical protein